MYIYIYICIYAIMKTMCPPGYHHNGFVATHALGHMMYFVLIYQDSRFEHFICFLSSPFFSFKFFQV